MKFRKKEKVEKIEKTEEEKPSLFRTIFGKWYLYLLGALLSIICFVLVFFLSGYYFYKNPDKLNFIKNDLVSK